MNMKAEVEVMCLQAKNAKDASKAGGERHGTNSPSQFLEGINPINTSISDFQLSECETIYLCCLSHLVCDTLL